MDYPAKQMDSATAMHVGVRHAAACLHTHKQPRVVHTYLVPTLVQELFTVQAPTSFGRVFLDQGQRAVKEATTQCLVTA
jgi:hypothetical protein